MCIRSLLLTINSKGAVMPLPKGTVDKTVSVLQSFFHAECSATHLFRWKSPEEIPRAHHTPPQTYTWEQILELYWRL